jgi:hypothetical protein
MKWNSLDAIEALYAEFRTEPEIAIRPLRNRPDPYFCGVITALPMCVLVDVERWIQR